MARLYSFLKLDPDKDLLAGCLTTYSVAASVISRQDLTQKIVHGPAGSKSSHCLLSYLDLVAWRTQVM